MQPKHWTGLNNLPKSREFKLFFPCYFSGPHYWLKIICFSHSPVPVLPFHPKHRSLGDIRTCRVLPPNRCPAAVVAGQSAFLSAQGGETPSSLPQRRTPNGTSFLLAKAAGNHQFHFHPFPYPIRSICLLQQSGRIKYLWHCYTWAPQCPAKRAMQCNLDIQYHDLAAFWCFLSSSES